MTASHPMAVQLAPLKDWAIRVFVKQGMFAAQAEIAALRLIESELLDRPAGGLRWLPRLMAAMDVGDIDPRARFVTLTDLPSLAVIDGSTGVGQVAVTQALQLGAKKACDVGSAVIVIKNSRPIGDPTACLAAATSAGCIAGIMTTCKKQSDPWAIGPCTVWGWPGAASPLITSSEAPTMDQDLFADVLAAGLGGKKPSALKKRLFADDAEYVCFVIDPAKCTDREQFQQVSQQAAGAAAMVAPPWIFDSAHWPETVPLAAECVVELRELSVSARMPAEW